MASVNGFYLGPNLRQKSGTTDESGPRSSIKQEKTMSITRTAPYTHSLQHALCTRGAQATNKIDGTTQSPAEIPVRLSPSLFFGRHPRIKSLRGVRAPTCHTARGMAQTERGAREKEAPSLAAS